MRIRAVTAADEAVVRELWEEFEAERPGPDGFAPEAWEDAWRDLRRHGAKGVALLAEDDAGPAGYAFARAPEHGRAHVTDVYVRPRARRHGLATALLADLAAGLGRLGAEWVSLDVLVSNSAARELYGRLGFEDVQIVMAARLETLAERSATARVPDGESQGAVYVQTDDQGTVEAAVRRFVLRLFRSSRTAVAVPRNGWTAVHDDMAVRDPQLLRRLAEELSHVTGLVVLSLGVEAGAVVRLAAFERGSLLDEYLSVPEHYGALPPGDAVALRANATVLARLTGAEPGRIREVARTAASATELRPPTELAGALAGVLGLDPPRRFADAAAEQGALIVEH
ncbi:MAG: N-acetyltransferase family protein [Gaiellaceae bacterium]